MASDEPRAAAQRHSAAAAAAAAPSLALRALELEYGSWRSTI
jgi:hypothetical protein